MSKNLPKELTRLVDWAVTELGNVIKSELGSSGFARIERIRKHVKSGEGSTIAGLGKLQKELSSLSKQDRFHVAHSFALMLELINSCETAYRAFRLEEEFKEDLFTGPHKFGRVIHVLTAHPTESRSPDIIYYFKKIQNLLEKRLQQASDTDEADLHILLKWVWRIPMSKQRKPSVMDEAEYIYSLVLQKDVIDYFMEQQHKNMPFYIRTWVGGDKDGHPGVNDQTMLGSLQMSRVFLIRWLEEKYEAYLVDLLPLAHSADTDRSHLKSLVLNSKNIKRDLRALKKLKSGDAKKVQKLRADIQSLQKYYLRIFKVSSPALFEVEMFFRVFPGLVVPLELREASELVHQALEQPRKPSAISRMLKKLEDISSGHDPRFYVRGFVLSQTESAADILAGVKLVERHLGQVRLPVVPLFESAHSLSNAVEIIHEFLKTQAQRSKVKKFWSSKIEVMVGYSDSSKENGAFPSRFLISTAIDSLQKVIAAYGFTPIFFHGSGGSIERGGGSVQEQTEWWPSSALDTVKVTVQGEMIYRSYAASDILKRQVQRFTEARDLAGKKKALTRQNKQDLKALSDSIQKSYRDILHDPHFLDLIELATPYSFMKDLKMGSRPAKRQGPVDLNSLRAIPWVLCWTQTRSLFPSWWGMGSFWKDLDKSAKARYKKLFKQSSLFRSYVKVLGFTLKKIELEVFGFYLQSSKLPKEVSDSFYKRFKKEIAECRKAVREISGESSLLWYRPWLETSIELRSPLIHPLNVLQLLALKDKDVPLLRETVTGIASGMLTTG